MNIIDEMEKVRTACKLGLQIREQEGIRVRQPLETAIVKLPLLEFTEEIIKDELNVKQVVFIDDTEGFCTHDYIPSAKEIAKNPENRKVMKDIMKKVKSGEIDYHGSSHIEITIDGDTLILIEPEYSRKSILIDKEGHAGMSEGDIVVSLDTRIDISLEIEGYARDILRHIQLARREHGAGITDKITLDIKGGYWSDRVKLYHSEYIEQEGGCTITTCKGKEYPYDIGEKGVVIIE